MNEGVPNQEPKENSIEQNKPTSFETEKGSEYRYLPDGKTQRFKKVEDKEYPPQDVIVFIPDWKTVEANAPQEFLKDFNNNPLEYEQTLLKYAQEMKVYITDGSKKINSNEEAAAAENLFIALCKDSDSSPDYVIPVSAVPKENFSPYDTRKFLDESSNEWKREQHIGNGVIKINYDTPKSKTI